MYGNAYVGAAFAAETETNNSLLTAVPISAQAGTENVKTAEYAVESGVITDVAESNGYMRVSARNRHLRELFLFLKKM